MKNKKIILLIIGILLVISALVGVSYAYYIKSHNQEESNIVKTKCLNFSITNEKNDINLDEQYPITDSEGRKLTPYQFTITNTCEQFISYNVNLESLETTTMDSNAVKVMINNEAPVNLSTLESTAVSIDSSKDSKILATGSLGRGDSVDYALRVWMDYGDSADTSSMNKVFESKIVVTATVGTYKPSDYVTTLHDAILVNEYGVTDINNAISRIEAKGTPDLSNTAPIIIWKETVGKNQTRSVIKLSENSINSDEATSSLSDNETKIRIYKNKTFDSSTAMYSLTDSEYLDPTELDFNGNNHYYFREEYIAYNQSTGKLYSVSGHQEHVVYEIIGATKTIESRVHNNNKTYESIVYSLETIELTETETEVDRSDKGLYFDSDDFGTTYYYRGNVTNNYVEFGGYYWKIVRINGDGSIRLAYYCDNKNLDNCSNVIGYSKFNPNNNSPAYVGYMYGKNEDSRENIVKNEVESEIKSNLDNWFVTNILNKNFSNYISDAGFCGDRTLHSGDGFSFENDIQFSGVNRFNNNTALLKCSDSNDLYTTSNSSYGNKALTYPIGLITYDELVFSGMNSSSLNTLSYLYSSTNYWLMTPASIGKIRQNAAVFFQDATGMPNPWWGVRNTFGIRPVINLKADVEISGGIGTISDPYVIKTE